MTSLWAASLALLFTTLFGCATDDVSEEVLEEEVLEIETAKSPSTHPDQSGSFHTISATGTIDLQSEFFDSLGTNGRSCGSCHIPAQAFSITAAAMQKLFDTSKGLAPVFRMNDGAIRPDADVSTLNARRAAYHMLRTRGLFRIGLPIPANAEFELIAVDDPYGYASAAELSLFRRPLPSTNLAPLSIVMWDGRETGTTLVEALAKQANDATMGHAQADGPLSDAIRYAIVDFEMPLYTAQLIDRIAGRLDHHGGHGGPTALSTMTMAAGRMDLYDAWIGASATDPRTKRRAAIARGQELFNTRTPSGSMMRCGNCHKVANVGTGVGEIFFDIKVADGARRTPDMPLYTLRNLATGQTRTTTDPGRALITGRWSDVNRFKVPTLRALAARAPYFHNGSAATLEDVVAFYSAALNFQFTPTEAADLVAFLSAL